MSDHAKVHIFGMLTVINTLILCVLTVLMFWDIAMMMLIRLLWSSLKRNCTTSPSYKMVECAELLKDTVNCADWAFFMKNGSDATTFSVMCARAHTGKKENDVL